MQSTALSRTEHPRPSAEPTKSASLPLPWAVATAVLAGVSLDLAYPSSGLWMLAIPSVILILLSLIGRRTRSAFLVGGVYGTTFFLLHLDWVGSFLGPVPWLALASFQTVIVAAGCALIAWAYRWGETRLHGRWARLIVLPLVIASVWVLRESVAGSWPYTGFPWARLGITQSNGPLVEIVSWTGIAGLTFLLVAFSAAALQAVRAWRVAGLRSAVMPAAAVCVLVFAPQFPTTDAGSFTVGWVQGNGPSGYFDRRSPGEVLASYVDATDGLLGEDVDVLAWPEGSVDSDPLRNPQTARILDEVARAVRAPVLVNAATDRNRQTFNTSLLWDPTAPTPQVHDKRNPVPFGEYVPDRWFFEAVAPELVGLIKREYARGDNPPIMRVNDTRVGLAICFDVIYDDVIRESAAAGAQVLIFQTNNADFRNTDENLQQLAFARMRAVETGRAVINVSTVGTSQAIAPDGSIIHALPINTTASAVTTLPLRDGTTPAVQFGRPIEVLLSVGGVAFCLVVSTHARFRTRAPRKGKS